MAGESPSFGYLVFGRAVRETWRFFQYTLRDIILGVITFGLGIALAVHFVGRADTMKEIAFTAAFTFAPVGILVCCVFIWNLWLAPAALAYESAAMALARVVPPPTAFREVRPPAPDYQIWKQRDFWTVQEFACLLDDVDPSSSQRTSRVDGFKRLILEETRAKKLNYIVRRIGGTERIAPDDFTRIPKADALQWANAHGFSTEKLK